MEASVGRSKSPHSSSVQYTIARLSLDEKCKNPALNSGYKNSKPRRDSIWSLKVKNFRFWNITLPIYSLWIKLFITSVLIIT
jgi:hypothetical protein